MYPLFETLCIKDGKIQNSEWHQNRYENDYEVYYSKKPDSNLIDNIDIPKDYCSGIYKLRISYNDQDRKHEFHKYVFGTIETLRLIEDNTIEYNLKYSDRTHIQHLFNQKGNCDDVLIVKNGMITDTCYANIVFTDGANWFTPSTPLLRGTCRARLLAQNQIEVTDISVKDLPKFTGFVLINAMNDFDKNKVKKMEGIRF